MLHAVVKIRSYPLSSRLGCSWYEGMRQSQPVSTSSAQDLKRPGGKVIVITGPTAVGKTSLGLGLAKRLGGEIISADSVQVYRGLDIGSDKLPIHQREGIPHHLIDTLEPHEEFSAGYFHDEGRQAIADILQRGKVPIVVGGTGFYLRWLIYGKATAPPSNPHSEAHAEQLIQEAWQRAAAEAGPEGEGELGPDAKWEAAVKLIADLGDPETAVRVLQEKNNYYRLRRVLQILLQNGGRPISMHEVGTDRQLDYDFRCFFLNRPRIGLYDKIFERVEQMVATGLLSEALMLLDQGVEPNSNMASKAIGYRQAMVFLDSALKQEQPVTGAEVINLVHAIGTASRNLVKNQTTYFRDEPLFHWVDARNPEAAFDEVLSHLEREEHIASCGDSGRLDKAAVKALKQYQPRLQLFQDKKKLQEVVDWVNQHREKRMLQEQLEDGGMKEP